MTEYRITKESIAEAKREFANPRHGTSSTCITAFTSALDALCVPVEEAESERKGFPDYGSQEIDEKAKVNNYAVMARFTDAVNHYKKAVEAIQKEAEALQEAAVKWYLER